MTEASVSFAGNLTDDPEVRYTEGGIARLPSLGCWIDGRVVWSGRQ
jgi:single-stranded DNA-binding protein